MTTKYRYKADICESSDPAAMEKWLNNLGKLGWQLVDMDLNPVSRSWHCVFIREAEPKKKKK